MIHKNYMQLCCFSFFEMMSKDFIVLFGNSLRLRFGTQRVCKSVTDSGKACAVNLP